MRSWVLLIVIILGISNLANATPVLNYDKSWKWIEGNSIEHTYWVIDNIHTWDNAHGEMSLLGTGYYLATITSQEEQKAMADGLSGLTGEFWLGGVQDLTAAGSELGWYWADTGEAFSYTNWQANEPNDYGNGGNGNSEWHLGTWSRYNWKWNDEHGKANIKGYIVETQTAYLTNPEPTTMVLFGFGLISLAGLGRRLNKKKTDD